MEYPIILRCVQIPTGSMSGLIRNDQVEVYHILRPSVRTGGRVVNANQLDCTVEVVEGKKKLAETLDAIYQVNASPSYVDVLHLIPHLFFFKKRMKSFAQKMGLLNVFVW